MAMLIIIILITTIMLLRLLLALVKLLLSPKPLVKSFTFITPMFAVVYALLLSPIYMEGNPSRGQTSLPKVTQQFGKTGSRAG